MADTPLDTNFPSREDIEAAAVMVQSAAARKRAEELHYVPLDSPHRYLAGKNVTDPQNRNLATTGYATDERGVILGTPDDHRAVFLEYGWIPEAFAHHVDPDPDNFNYLMATVEAAARTLRGDDSPVSRNMRLVQDHLAQWTGVAAEVFRNDFLSRIEAATANQATLAITLHEAMHANREIFVRVRQDLKAVADQTVVALDALGLWGGPGGDDVAVWLGVAAAVATMLAGIASTPISGGASLYPAGVAAWTFIAGATAGGSLLAGARGDGPRIRADLAADTVAGVLANMLDALARIDSLVTEAEQKIVSALETDADQVAKATTFVAPRPALIEASKNAAIKKQFTI